MPKVSNSASSSTICWLFLFLVVQFKKYPRLRRVVWCGGGLGRLAEGGKTATTSKVLPFRTKIYLSREILPSPSVWVISGVHIAMGGPIFYLRIILWRLFKMIPWWTLMNDIQTDGRGKHFHTDRIQKKQGRDEFHFPWTSRSVMSRL